MKTASFASRSFGLLVGVWLLGCSSSSTLPLGTVTLHSGQEADAWFAAPPATTIRVDLVQATGRTPVGDVRAPATTDPAGSVPVLTLGRGGPQGVKAHFEATAFDDQDNPVMQGVGSTFTLFGFDAASLYIFLGRSGFARPFGTLHGEHRHPLLMLWPNAYLLIIGSDSPGSDPTQLDVYSAALGSLSDDEPALPLAARSGASSRSKILLLGDTDNLWLDPTNSSTSAATAPDGLRFSELVGGKTLLAADGAQYLVGATRSTGEPSDKVLRVDPDGTLQALVLSMPRLGAAAALVGDNLVVAGGNAHGSGAEVLAAGATNFVPLELPADATAGAALAELTPSTAILVAGKDPISGSSSGLRTIDLGCTSDCAFLELGPFTPALDRAQAFALSSNRVLVVGDGDDGETHAFSLDVSGENPEFIEQPLRERRAGASAALLPNGQVVVAGGDQLDSQTSASSIELFFP